MKNSPEKFRIWRDDDEEEEEEEKFKCKEEIDTHHRSSRTFLKVNLIVNRERMYSRYSQLFFSLS